MQPLIITVAITGAEISKDKVPHLPTTAEEQALEAKKCFDAGATILHLHVRDENNEPTQSLMFYQKSYDAIKSACPEMILQVTTGGSVKDTPEMRATPLKLSPEMSSLNMGTMNFGDDIFMNDTRTILYLAEQIQSHNVVPELEIYDLGMLEYAGDLVHKGILKSSFKIQFVLGVRGGASGDPDNLTFLVTKAKKIFGENVLWSVAGIGRYQLPLCEQAIQMGGHVRVGLEDNLLIAKGQPATSNVDFVNIMNELATKYQRQIATSSQARRLLAL